MTTARDAAVPAEGKLQPGDLRLNNGRWEVFAQTRPAQGKDQPAEGVWVPVPDMSARMGAYDLRKRGATWEQLTPVSSAPYFYWSPLQATDPELARALSSFAGIDYSGVDPVLIPSQASGMPDMTLDQLLDVLEGKTEADVTPQTYTDPETGERFLVSKGGGLTRLAQQQQQGAEDPLIARFQAEAEAARQQAAARQQEIDAAPRSIDAAIAPRLAELVATGRWNEATRLISLTQQPSTETMLELAMQFADRPESLRILFDFIRGRGIPGLEQPETLVQAQIAQVDGRAVQGLPPEMQTQFADLATGYGFQSDPATGQWVRTGQSEIARLRETDPRAGAARQAALDPSGFLTDEDIRFGRDLPTVERMTETYIDPRTGEVRERPLQTPQQAGMDFLETRNANRQGFEDISDAALTATVLDPQTTQIVRGAAQRELTRRRQEREAGVEGSANPFGEPVQQQRQEDQPSFQLAEPSILQDPTRQPGRGQTRLYNPETDEVRIIGSEDVSFALTQPQYAGFQVKGAGSPVPVPAPVAQRNEEEEFQSFRMAAQDLARPRRDDRRRTTFRPSFIIG